MVSVSVVMPTYNTPVPFLREAVDSILQQTFRDFEFIIIDDGSTDDSVAYLQSLRDKRVRLIRNPKNLGISKSLNIGFRAAQGKYIARMDSDDISLPMRLEKQYAFMEKHPDMMMCGSNIERFGAYSKRTHHRINDMERYRISALFVNPGPSHPTIIINRELLTRYNISYDEDIKYAEDYGLYAEICKHGTVSLLKEILLQHRIHNQQVSIAHRERQIQDDKAVQKKLLLELLDSVTEEELDIHYRYGTRYYKDAKLSDAMLKWFNRLIAANDRLGVYNKKKFRRYVYDIIVKQTIYRSFDQNMNTASRIAMFFHYMPFDLALKALLGMCARTVFRRLRG